MTTDDERRYNPFYDPDDCDAGIFPDHNGTSNDEVDEVHPLDDGFGDFYDPPSPEDSQRHNVGCTTCGVTLSSDRAECAVCSTSDRPDPTGPNDQASGNDVGSLDSLVDRLIFAIVPASSRFEAIVRGTRGLHRRDTSGSFPSDFEGETFELVHNLSRRELIPYARRWGALPDAVPVAAKTGLQLFTQARERTSWTDGAEASVDGPAERAYLFSEEGTAIHDRTQLVPLLAEYLAPSDEADCSVTDMGRGEEELWLVPAVGFKAVRKTSQTSLDVSKDERERLYCDVCTKPLIHEYCADHRLTPDTVDGNHPEGNPTDLYSEADAVTFFIWSCRRCRTDRYGPDPYEATE
ncbi:hypothetical protein [Halosimplex carlsbadense]|uniref:hypothetical protein n=1 Tax=Halosimplex carlsbadense TaxID=171164 RepID=UPI001267EF78|nr:hypothetical protein [Halosimplex carlsbadense]